MDVITCLERQQIKKKHTVKIIIIDDQSDDGTWEALNERKYTRPVEILRTQPRNTWSAAIPRNVGAKSADGDTECFLFLDSDILLPPDRIQAYINNWKEDPDPKRVIIGPYHYIKDRDHRIDVSDEEWYTRDIQGYAQDIRWQSFLDHPKDEKNAGWGWALACFGGSIMIPRDLFFKAGMYDEYCTAGVEDGDFGITLWETGAVFSLNASLLGWHNWHEITAKRTENLTAMVEYLDRKHRTDIVKQTGEVYRTWGIEWADERWSGKKKKGKKK